MPEGVEGKNPTEATVVQKPTWKDKLGRLFGRTTEVPISTDENARLEADIHRALEIASEDERLLAVVHPEGIPTDLREEYNRRPEIEELYSQAAYWHGTGRRQYREDHVVDVLDQIVEQSSLLPRPDPFDVSQGGVVNTVSLSDRRAYSAGYARMHLENGQNLGYQYMSDKFWGIFLRITAREAIGRTNLEKMKKIGSFAWNYLKESKNPTYLFKLALNLRKNAMSWVNKVTKEKYKYGYVSAMFTVHSDIPGNYPILIGVKEGVFTPMKTAQYIDKFEVRANTPIPLSCFTHIEVPQRNVAETQDFLSQRGVNDLSVVPMELGEVHSSQFTPQQLVQGNPFRK